MNGTDPYTTRTARRGFCQLIPAANGGWVLVIYRNTRPGKVDQGTNRRFGETGQGESVQLEADRMYYPVSAARQAGLRGVVYIADGIVVRVRAVDPAGTWQHDHRGYADIPLTAPLTDLQVAQLFPTLGLCVGDVCPRVRGRIRKYRAL
jgi:hypothetical protein